MADVQSAELGAIIPSIWVSQRASNNAHNIATKNREHDQQISNQVRHELQSIKVDMTKTIKTSRKDLLPLTIVYLKQSGLVVKEETVEISNGKGDYDYDHESWTISLPVGKASL